jgi:hypothetical protein
VVLSTYALALATFLVSRVVIGELALYHFTYWGLILSLVLSVTWVATSIVDHLRGVAGLVQGLEAAVLALGAPPVVGVLTLVGVLITAVPIMDPAIVEAQGGDLQLGLINFYNLLMHYLPIFVFGICLASRWSLASAYYATLGRHLGAKGVKGLRGRESSPTAAVYGGPDGDPDDQTSLLSSSPEAAVVVHRKPLMRALVLHLALLLPFTIANLYTSLFDFNKEYGVDIVPVRAFAVGLVYAALYFLVMRWLILDDGVGVDDLAPVESTAKKLGPGMRP